MCLYGCFRETVFREKKIYTGEDRSARNVECSVKVNIMPIREIQAEVYRNQTESVS